MSRTPLGNHSNSLASSKIFKGNQNPEKARLGVNNYSTQLNPVVNEYLNSGVPVPNSYKQMRKEGVVLASNHPQRSRSEN
jgi:hypothetical protein